MNKFLFSKWIDCGLVPDNVSVKYGLYFSYPVYLLIVVCGVLFTNQYILMLAAVLAFLSIKLPLHPLDYIYNYVFSRILRKEKIPARGSELQVNGVISLLFCLFVIIFVVFNFEINFTVLAVIYLLSSVFFTLRFLLK